jgi:hypothetical protein
MHNSIPSFTRLLNDAKNLSINPNDSFMISYNEFIKFFSITNEIDYHSMVIGIHFTYAWMPTIFDFRSGQFDNVLLILNKVKSGTRIDKEELEILKKCFNNSLVGTSKILHFINPEKFAIWDSRVYRYLFQANAYDYRISNCNTYLTYLEMCDKVSKSPEFEEIHKIVEKKAGYPISKLRSLELIMYTFGGK